MLSTNRRRNISALIALCLTCALFTQGCGRKKKQKIYYDNKVFYDEDGNFEKDAAVQAYVDLLKWHEYEFDENMTDRIWVTDFGLGKFSHVGVGMMVWANDAKNNYSGVTVMLLPLQMTPEHWYVKTPESGPRPKDVHCRYGSVYLYGEGTPTPKVKAKVPEFQKLHVTVWKERVLNVGEVGNVSNPAGKRWEQGGPMGAVFSEYSTFHTNDAMRFTDPHVKVK